MEFLNKLSNLLFGDNVKPITYKDPDTGLDVVAIVAPNGWQLIKEHPARLRTFPSPAMADVPSFIEYMINYKEFEKSAIFANAEGIRGVINYADERDIAGRRTHHVTLPAAYSEATSKPMAALKSIIGKTITLEQFEAALQTAALIILQGDALLETINNIESNEVSKVVRGQKGFEVAFAGNVKAENLPSSISAKAAFMGQAISFSLPFRCFAKANQIMFQIIDNGALDKAVADAAAATATAIHEALPDIPMYSGRITG